MLSMALLASITTPSACAKGGKKRDKHVEAKEQAPSKAGKSSLLKTSTNMAQAVSLTFEYTGKYPEKKSKGPSSGHIWTIGGWVPDETERSDDFQEVRLQVACIHDYNLSRLCRQC